MPRRRARCLRRRSRMLFSSGLASSTTSPAGSILRRTSAISRSNDAAPSTDASRAAETTARARRMPPTVGLHGREERARGRAGAAVRARALRRRAPRGSRRAPLGARSAISPAPERKRAPSAVVGSARETSAGVVSAAAARPAARAPGGVCASRAHGRHDAIELEGLEGSGVHGLRCAPRAGSAIFEYTRNRSARNRCGSDLIQVIDRAGDRGGAEAVVDVHDGNARGAAV